MNPLRIGIAGAAVIAGPPLYSLVETGMLDSSAALGRGVVVAVACAAGALYVQRLIEGYEQEWQALQDLEGEDADAPADGDDGEAGRNDRPGATGTVRADPRAAESTVTEDPAAPGTSPDAVGEPMASPASGATPAGSAPGERTAGTGAVPGQRGTGAPDPDVPRPAGTPRPERARAGAAAGGPAAEVAAGGGAAPERARAGAAAGGPPAGVTGR